MLNCIPHASGDEPRFCPSQNRVAVVYPTRVGMNRYSTISTFSSVARIPHASGDEPPIPCNAIIFSFGIPHVSGDEPRCTIIIHCVQRIPHASGDEPAFCACWLAAKESIPHASGDEPFIACERGIPQ